MEYEPPHDKTNKMVCAPSKDSDQPGHLPSLIRVFAVRMKKAWVLYYPLTAQQRLIRLGRCPGWSESSLGAHAILLILSWGGSYCDFSYYLLVIPQNHSQLVSMETQGTAWDHCMTDQPGCWDVSGTGSCWFHLSVTYMGSVTLVGMWHRISKHKIILTVSTHGCQDPWKHTTLHETTVTYGHMLPRPHPPPHPGHLPPYENWHVRTFAPQRNCMGGHLSPHYLLLKLYLKPFFWPK